MSDPNCFEKAWFYINRSLDWRLRKMEVKADEAEKLALNGITSRILQQYHLWRYASLLSALLLFVILEALFALGGFATYITALEVFNASGQLVFLLSYLGEITLAVTVVVAFIYCLKKPHLSAKILTYGWLAATILPLVPVFFPFEHLLTEEVREVYLNTGEGFALRVVLVATYAIAIFPAIVSIPSGLIRGAMRVRGLLPTTTLAGWLIVATCPLYPLVALGSISLLVQAVSGNTILLIVGAVSFMMAPLGFAFRRQLFTRPKLGDAELDQITLTLRIIGGVQAGGMVLISFWALMNTDVSIGVLGVFQFIVGFVGRLLVTTLVFADIVLEITASNLKETRESQEATILGETENLLQSFEAEYFKLAEGEQNLQSENATNPAPVGGAVAMTSRTKPNVVATAVPASETTTSTSSSWYEAVTSAVLPCTPSPPVVVATASRPVRSSVDP